MGWGREMVGLIKSLNAQEIKDALEVRLQKIELNLSADKIDPRLDLLELGQ